MTLSQSLSKLNKFAFFRQFSTKTLTQSAPTKRTYKRNPNPKNNPTLQNFPKPSTIPYQSKVANSVHLVGSIGVPVKFYSLPNGDYAVSVIVQERKRKDLAQLCIPVIFQGELAHIATFHLKEKDLVYVTGHLSGEAMPQKVEDESQKTDQDSQNHLQVFANSLSFVKKTCPETECEIVHDQEAVASDCSDKILSEIARDQEEVASRCSAEVEEKPSALQLWNDYFAHPSDWWDNRSSKGNSVHAAFKHKKSGQRLWIDNTTPEWVHSKLEAFSSAETRSNVLDKSRSNDSLWNDLVNNPQQWFDKREDKLEKLVGPRYPDFEQKDTGKGLWLNSAPDWVLSKLDGLALAGSNNMRKNKDDLWKNLVENPNKWWDNRSSKLKPTSPDFKNKDTSECLWICKNTPQWALDKLPPAASNINVD